MKKRFLFLVLSALCALCVGAQRVSPLQFNADGEFKIVQITDVHFKVGNPASDVALKRINEVLDAERPDLVVFTGDVIFSKPADVGMRTVLQCVSSRGIPFALTFGNHDDEQGMSRTQLYDLVRTVPGNLLPERNGAASPDYVLTVKSSDGKRDAAVLYCMDSNTYSTLPGVKGYGWFRREQVEWYCRQSAAFAEANGGKPLPALAFFHIPLPEYNEAASAEEAVFVGTRMEKACAPQLNTGMFAAMREQGDVMATFVGHDHDNDYAVMWQDILLAYGRYGGGNTVYNHLPNGARVIVLKENARTFDSWIRLKGGQIIHRITCPDSFVKDDWEKRPLQVE